MTFNAASLSVEDKITDPLMPELDPSLLDFGPMNPITVEIGTGEQVQVDWANWSSSQVFPGSSVRRVPEQPRDDLDMNVELDLDLGDDDEPSIEIGRRDAAPVRAVEDLINDDDKFQGNGFIDDDPTEFPNNDPIPTMEGDNNLDTLMLDDNMEDVTAPTPAPALNLDTRLERDSESPLSSRLSSARSSVVRNFDEIILNEAQEEEEEEIPIHQPQHKAKKRKILPVDMDTVMSQSQIKQMQADRSAILKPLELLSSSPLLLNLLRMQQDGSFVSDIMADGRSKYWAPELRGILSLEKIDAARASWEMKQKVNRAAAIAKDKTTFADVPTPRMNTSRPQTPHPDTPQRNTPHPDFPQLEKPDEQEAVRFDEEEDEFHEALDRMDDNVADGGDTVMREPSEIMGLQSPTMDRFDETVAPLLYPTEQGAVSQGTRHAVHILRESFGSDGSQGLSVLSQQKPNILFQDLCPEAITTKADAARMFFEVLVLATKDAIKVEQSGGFSGAPMKIRAKRGLWGAWAEDEERPENEEAGEALAGPS